MNTITTDLDTGYNTETIDDRHFRFSVSLVNPDGKLLRIRKGAIEELTITDSILDWYTHGTLIIKNPQNAIERSVQIKQGERSIDTEQFRFRGDARDRILVEIEPLLRNDLQNPVPLNSDLMTMRYTFIVYAIEDIPSETADTKTKLLRFWDPGRQKLDEINLAWSTGHAKRRLGLDNSGVPLTQQTDDQRSLLTGPAIQDFLKQSLGDVQFADDFDEGGFKTYFAAPTRFKGIDTLNYLLDEHVSSTDTNNQPCIFKLDRFTNKFTLLPIETYFRRAYNKSQASAGAWNNEVFTIAYETSRTDVNTPIPKTPPGAGQGVNIHLPDASVIQGYSFIEMDGRDIQQMLVTRPVISYSSDSKKFTVSLEQNQIESIYGMFQDITADNLYGDTKTGAKALFYLNQTRKENKNISPIYSYSSGESDIITSGRNSILLNGLFNHNALQFTIKGSTHRRSGRFFSVDRSTRYSENDFDAKMLGQYFCVSVTHTFTTGSYTNDIIGVKPYTFKDLKYNEEIE